MSQNWELQLSCWKCGQPTIVYFLKYLPNKEMTVLKVRCPTHGQRVIKLPTLFKNEWLPLIKNHVFRCFKCGAPATFFQSKRSGHWRIFRLSCPRHREKMPNYQYSEQIYQELGIEGGSSSTELAVAQKATSSAVPVANNDVTPAIQAVPQTVEVLQDISVKRQFEHIGGLLRIKAKIVNDSENVITQVKMRFDVPQKPFHLIKIEPEYKTEGTTVYIPIVQPNTSKTVNYTLEPLVCGKDKIYGLVEYLDAKGNQQIIQINPLEVNVVCPLFFTEEEANVAKLNNLLQTRLNVRDERSYVIPQGLTPNRAYKIVKDVISQHDLRLVFEDINETAGDYRADSWFYGKTKVTKADFVITGNVSEHSGYVKVVVACDREEQLTGLLSEMGKKLREQIVANSDLNSEDELKSLRCPSCSGPLEEAPIEGRITFCPYCDLQIKLQDLEA
ncbi:MAG: hypothetical protein ACTSRW_05565 [Candidatus Helarchaeota archaeon]